MKPLKQIGRILKLACSWLWKEVKGIYLEAGPMILCVAGGLILHAANQVDAEGIAGFVLLLVPIFIWAFALDLVKQRAEAKGIDTGMIRFIAALEVADECNINIIHHDGANKEPKA